MYPMHHEPCCSIFIPCNGMGNFKTYLIYLATCCHKYAAAAEVYGHTQNIISSHNIPIAGIAGDQQAALFGQMCTQPGMVKNTYGTGCFMLMNTGEKPVASTNNLLTTVAWKVNGITHYALEGSVFIAGAVVQWLRDGLGIIKTSAEVETLAKQVTDSDGVYVVPAFAGLGCTALEPACKRDHNGYDQGHICCSYCPCRT